MRLLSRGITLVNAQGGFKIDQNSELVFPPFTSLTTAKGIEPKALVCLACLCCMCASVHVGDLWRVFGDSNEELKQGVNELVSSCTFSPAHIASCAMRLMDTDWSRRIHSIGLTLARKHGHDHVQNCFSAAIQRCIALRTGHDIQQFVWALKATGVVVYLCDSDTPIVLLPGLDGVAMTYTDHVLLLTYLVHVQSSLVATLTTELAAGHGLDKFWNESDVLVAEAYARSNGSDFKH